MTTRKPAATPPARPRPSRAERRRLPRQTAGVPPRERVVRRRGRRLHRQDEGAGAGRERRARPARLRHGRHHEPGADLGHGAEAAGRHVPRREGGGRPRRAARLFSRARRMPRLEVGVRSRRARAPDDERRLPRRPDADRQGARRTRVDESKKRKVNALVYVGDSMEEDVDRLCARAGELALLGVPVFLFQEGDDERPRERLPRDRAADQGRLLPLRPRLGAAAARSADGGRRLRRGRPQGAAGARAARRHGAGARLLLEQLEPAGR